MNVTAKPDTPATAADLLALKPGDLVTYRKRYNRTSRTLLIEEVHQYSPDSDLVWVHGRYVTQHGFIGKRAAASLWVQDGGADLIGIVRAAELEVTVTYTSDGRPLRIERKTQQ